MKLSVIFDALATGELNNLHLVQNYKVNDEFKEVVLQSLNLGLTDLFTRFSLRREYVEIPAIKNQREYEIVHSDFLELMDLAYNQKALFPNRDDGYVLVGLNRFYTGFNPDDNQSFVAEIRCKHRVLTKADIDVDSEVDLPLPYLNALVLFIGSRLYTSIVNQLDGDLNESNRYLQRYNAEIVIINNQGLDVDDLADMWLFHEKGFV